MEFEDIYKHTKPEETNKVNEEENTAKEPSGRTPGEQVAASDLIDEIIQLLDECDMDDLVDAYNYLFPSKAVKVEDVLNESRKINEEAFTKRHFIQIANVLKNAKTVDDVTEELVRIFTADNPRFDRDRFMRAVGKTEEQKPENKDEKK